MINVELVRDNSIAGIFCSIHKLLCQKAVRNDQTVGEYLSQYVVSAYIAQIPDFLLAPYWGVNISVLMNSHFHLMFLVASCWSEICDWTFASVGIRNMKVSLYSRIRYMKHRWHHSWTAIQFPDKSCGTYPGSECLWLAKYSCLPVFALWQ